ncbi:hypothetical protein CVT24_002003 [Panaeolus cyanescens]|uniref:Uncharacterized protein n=1 Tax=Panaeolus cyanescens TaxID=181874 RepID=A0A409YHK1_9AGAR|nr:hypothetical protein CVT24_002003 [Panaeolus cyanescens]
MFSGLHNTLPPDADLANQILADERAMRFDSFTANDAVTLGLTIRKRFRSTARHIKGKGMIISIQTIAGHPLFSCTVGDLGDPCGVSDVSLDSWERIESMINVVKRTGHSSYYVEKAISAMGKTIKQTGTQEDGNHVTGGAFPIWLQNAPCCPIAIVACYSGSSQEDHNVVFISIRDYLTKMRRQSLQENALAATPRPEHFIPRHENEDWLPGPQGPHPQDLQSEIQSGFNHHDEAQ